MKYLIVLTAFALISCGEKAAVSTAAYELKAEDFPAFIAQPRTLNIVDFHADWCPHCKQLSPILISIAEENPDTIRLGMVDVDAEKALASQQRVRGIPDVRFYVDGKLVDKFTGAVPKEQIEQIIAKHASKTPAPIETSIQPAKENPLPPGMLQK